MNSVSLYTSHQAYLWVYRPLGPLAGLWPLSRLSGLQATLLVLHTWTPWPPCVLSALLALRSLLGLKALRPFGCLPAFPLALQASRPRGLRSTLLVDVSALGQMEKRGLKRGRSSFTMAPRAMPTFQPRCRGMRAPTRHLLGAPILAARPSAAPPGANGRSGGSGQGRASPLRAACTGHSHCPPPLPESGHRPGPLPLSSVRPRRPPARPHHPGPGGALALPWRRPPPPGPGAASPGELTAAGVPRRADVDAAVTSARRRRREARARLRGGGMRQEEAAAARLKSRESSSPRTSGSARMSRGGTLTSGGRWGGSSARHHRDSRALSEHPEVLP